MAGMAREAWTDERLDDLKDQVVEGFKRVDSDIRERRVGAADHGLRVHHPVGDHGHRLPDARRAADLLADRDLVGVLRLEERRQRHIDQRRLPAGPGRLRCRAQASTLTVGPEEASSRSRTIRAPGAAAPGELR